MTSPSDHTTLHFDGPRAVEPFQKKIMVVEDDPGLMSLYRILLHSRGYRVVGAEDGEEALRTVEEEGGAIDLMIVDLCLPKVSGFDMLARLNATNQCPPVLVCSGIVGSDIEKRLSEVGAPRFLPKPFRNREMLDEVESLLQSAA